MQIKIYIIHIYHFRRYVTLGRPPPLFQSVTLGRHPPPPSQGRYVIVERPLDWAAARVAF